MQELQDDIILAFQQGDEQAFQAVFEYFYQPIFNFCKHIVPLEEAKDITAETFYKLWKMRDRWNKVVNVKAFLFVTAKNACLNFIRDEKYRTGKLQEIANSQAKQEELFALSELQSGLMYHIRSEIENLSENCRNVFVLAYLENYTNQEIAGQLQLSEQTVKNLKSLALKNIRAGFLKKGLDMTLVSFFLLLTCAN